MTNGANEEHTMDATWEANLNRALDRGPTIAQVKACAKAMGLRATWQPDYGQWRITYACLPGCRCKMWNPWAGYAPGEDRHESVAAYVDARDPETGKRCHREARQTVSLMALNAPAWVELP